ncbi:TetR/AcrR family transcriptional regulator [Nonomuraea sp. NPDC046570]|uniref:TetR/AcrR family transcriptional regulator n=1 Tax=Nonomuraea sp. NPDC046570 TaxID=3155255 RepID=UPI0033DC6125
MLLIERLGAMMAGMEITSARVERAALDLFAAKGYAATGIRELADRAGVSTAALYQYMGAKEDLLVRLMHRGNSRLLQLGQQVLESAGSPAERLARLVVAHVVAHVRDPAAAKVIDIEMRSLSQENRQAVVAVRDAYERLWRDALTDGRNDQSFRFYDLGVARLALLEMATGVANWYSPGGPLDEVTLGETFVDIAFGVVDARDRHDRRLGHRDVTVPDVAGILDEILTNEQVLAANRVKDAL